MEVGTFAVGPKDCDEFDWPVDRAEPVGCEGAELDRFAWLDDADIGALDPLWNWLAIEYDDNPAAKLVHYTLGTPCFRDYRDTAMADLWHDAHRCAEQGIDA